jgi:hypothetical protein
MPASARSWIVLLAWCGTACSQAPEGLRVTPEGDGPVVVWDLLQKPIPELPLPNDIATRPDPSSPTGKRLNASLLATSEYEQTLREKLNRMSGWGTSQPIQISFDAPIDLDTILAGHRDWDSGNGVDYDFTNDVIYLIDVTPGSPTYQEMVPLDFGDGNFPDYLRRTDLYFENDPNVTSAVLLYESFDEDRNGNGELDPGEDIDMDGHLDKPNTYAPLDGNPDEVHPYDDLVTFYEFSTNTVVARPLSTLRQATTYAVVVTEDLQGESGDPIRSPFQYVNHVTQTDELQPALEALEGVGRGVDDVAFAWTFTTQDVHHELVMVRDGLYGAGPLAWLAEDFEPELTELHVTRDPDHPVTGEPITNPYVVPGAILERLVEPLASELFGAEDTSVMAKTHRYPAYHVSGAFETPYLLDMPGEERWNGVWPADLTDPSIRDRIGRRTVNFICTIPRWQYKLEDETGPCSLADNSGCSDAEIEAAKQRAASVALVGHGYGLNRLTHLGGYSPSYNKFGVAGCEFEAPDHGLELGPDITPLFRALLASVGLSPLARKLEEGRARDIDDDGAVDSGDTWFGADGYRIRDSFRQWLVDYMAFIRVMRSFDGERTMPWDVDLDGDNEIAGDFDGDGYVDLGGEDADYFATGESLGGIKSSMLSGIEPRIVAGAPISGGAGLTTLALKTEQGGAYEPFSLQVMGPAWIGERESDGRTRVYQMYANGNDEERTTVGWFEEGEIEEGDVVMVTNVDKDIAHCARVLSDDSIPQEYRDSMLGLQPGNMNRGNFFERMPGSFRTAVVSDRGDRIRIEVLAASATEDPVEVEFSNLECHKREGATVRAVLDRWQTEKRYVAPYAEEINVSPGDRLVSLEQGLGFKRAHPLARKAIGLVGVSVEAGDPVNYAPIYAQAPLEYREGDETFTAPSTNVLDVVTVGDPAVPVSLGIHIARAAGFIEMHEPDEKWGKTPNRAIVDSKALEAIPWLDRFPGYEGQLMDIDNQSDSMNTAEPDSKHLSNDGFDSPRLDPPLRLQVKTPGTTSGVSGLAVPMPEDSGAHVMVVGTHSQTDVWDVGTYEVNQIAYYFHTRGQEILYKPCLEDTDACDEIPNVLQLPTESCTEDHECTSRSCVDGSCAWESW